MMMKLILSLLLMLSLLILKPLLTKLTLDSPKTELLSKLLKTKKLTKLPSENLTKLILILLTMILNLKLTDGIVKPPCITL
jgi:hypothetical protein